MASGLGDVLNRIVILKIRVRTARFSGCVLCVHGVLKHQTRDFFHHLESEFILEGGEHPCGDVVMVRSEALRCSDGVMGSPGLSVHRGRDFAKTRLTECPASSLPPGYFVAAFGSVSTCSIG